MAEDSSKVVIQSRLESFFIQPINDNVTYRQEFSASVIQEDRKNPGNIIAAFEGQLVFFWGDGTPRHIIGTHPQCGFREGGLSEVQFCNISGLAQLESPEIIIADTGNHCLRKYDLLNWNITSYGGECSNDTSLNNSTNCQWTDGPLNSTSFCSPSTLQYVQSQKQILVLDTKESTNESAILVIDHDNVTISTLYKADFVINDFKYHEKDNTLILASVNGSLLRVSLSEEYPMVEDIFADAGFRNHCSASINYNNVLWVKSMKAKRFMEINGLYVVSDANSRDVLLLDPHNDIYVPLSLQIKDSFATSITDPVSLAYVDSYLYISNTLIITPSLESDRQLQINRVAMSVSPNYTVPDHCFLGCCEGEYFV